MQLILASTSPYRQKLLAEAKFNFLVVDPVCDESLLPNEPAMALASRLASKKAQNVFKQYPKSIVIGSDQVAYDGQTILTKPQSVAKAKTQLELISGKSVYFYTALTILAPDYAFQHIDTTVVKMRQLTVTEIDNYIRLEPDCINCAGAAKAEGLGKLLIEEIQTHDPNAVIGLPILSLIKELKKFNLLAI